MARYRKYDVRISLDERVRNLSPMAPSGEALWYYLLSMPESTMIPGLSRVGRAAIAEARGWDLEAFDKAFGEVFAEGLAEADWASRVLWIPNVVKYDPPTNPNVVLGWATHWDEIPDCPLKSTAWERLHDFFQEWTELKRQETKRDGDPEVWVKAFLKACPKPSGKASRKPLPKPCAPARIRKQDTGYRIQEEKKEPPLSPADPERFSLDLADGEPETEALSDPVGRVESEPEPKAADPPGFTAFWNLYPRKDAKGDARKAWLQTAKRRPPLEDLLAAVERGIASYQWQKEGGEYIPMPAGWLRKERWGDTYQPAHSRAAPSRPLAPGTTQAHLDEARRLDREMGLV